MRNRWLTVLGFVVAVAAVGVPGADCAAQPATGKLTPQSATDTLAELDKTPAQVVGVTLLVKPGAVDQVAAAAKKAGASSVNPLYGKQSVVMQGNAAQVHAAVDTGQVLQIHRN